MARNKSYHLKAIQEIEELEPDEAFYEKLIHGYSWPRVRRWARDRFGFSAEESRPYWEQAKSDCVESFEGDPEILRAILASVLLNAANMALLSNRPLQAIQAIEAVARLQGLEYSEGDMVMSLTRAGYSVSHPEFEQLSLNLILPGSENAEDTAPSGDDFDPGTA